jgi:hypothetical protein
LVLQSTINTNAEFVGNFVPRVEDSMEEHGISIKQIKASIKQNTDSVNTLQVSLANTQ